MSENLWLRCKVTKGQFSGEYAVVGQAHDGEEFSLFVPEESVDVDGDPSIAPVDGFLHVTMIAQEGELALVELPVSALENGLTVTVKTDALDWRSARQEA